MHFRLVILNLSNNVKGSVYDDCDINFLLQDPMFNTDLAQALNQVDDPLVTVEVIQFCMLNAQLSVITMSAALFNKMCKALVDIQKEQQALDKEFLQHLEGSKQRLITGRAKLHVGRQIDVMNQNRDLRARFYWVCEHQHPYLPCLNSSIVTNTKLLKVMEAQDKVNEYALYKAKMVEKRQKRHTC